MKRIFCKIFHRKHIKPGMRAIGNDIHDMVIGYADICYKCDNFWWTRKDFFCPNTGKRYKQ